MLRSLKADDLPPDSLKLMHAEAGCSFSDAKRNLEKLMQDAHSQKKLMQDVPFAAPTWRNYFTAAACKPVPSVGGPQEVVYEPPATGWPPRILAHSALSSRLLSMSFFTAPLSNSSGTHASPLHTQMLLNMAELSLRSASDVLIT